MTLVFFYLEVSIESKVSDSTSKAILCTIIKKKAENLFGVCQDVMDILIAIRLSVTSYRDKIYPKPHWLNLCYYWVYSGDSIALLQESIRIIALAQG